MTYQRILFLVIAIVACIGYASATAQTATQNMPDSDQDSCIDHTISDIKAKYTPLDEKRTKESATNFMLKSHASYRPGPVSQTWTNDPAHCTATLKNIQVQFVSESPEKTITLMVEPDSYAVKGIRTHQDMPRHDSATSPSWGGYAIKGNAAEPSSFVYRSTMNWNIPIPNDPPQLDCGTLNAQKCYVSVWTGLSKTIDGTSDMAQVGTDSVCLGNDCISGRQYAGWLETVPGGHISDCAGNTFAPGDSMYGEVANHKKDGGPVNMYDFYLIDTTQNQTCSSLNYAFGSTDPHYGLYMTERPNLGGTLAHLAGFGTIPNLYGTIFYDGTNKNIYVPYSTGTGWYRQWVMNNGMDNESVSEINSSNQFSVIWITSQGT